jgi:hypothetical protein
MEEKMTDSDKQEFLGNLKDLLSGDDKDKKTSKTTKTTTAKKTTTTAKKGVSKTAKKSLDAYKAKKAAEDPKKQAEKLHAMTHQDLINAAYKAAEKLGIAPWVLLRAAGWGHFTDDRGKKYDGPAIDEIEGLDDAQKKALKGVLDL